MSEFYILDASALLCLLQEEKGAERVARALPAAKIGAVNYSEVVGKLVEARVDEAKIDRLVDALQLTVVPFDRTQARLTGLLRAATRRLGLSLGDRACLAWLRLKARRLSPAIEAGRNSSCPAGSRHCAERRPFASRLLTAQHVVGRRHAHRGGALLDCFVAALLAMTSAGPSPAALRRGLLRRCAPRNDDCWAVAGRAAAWIASSS